MRKQWKRIQFNPTELSSAQFNIVKQSSIACLPLEIGCPNSHTTLYRSKKKKIKNKTQIGFGLFSIHAFVLHCIDISEDDYYRTNITNSQYAVLVDLLIEILIDFSPGLIGDKHV